MLSEVVTLFQAAPLGKGKDQKNISLSNLSNFVFRYFLSEFIEHFLGVLFRIIFAGFDFS